MGRLRRLINFAAPAILAGALFTAGSGNMQAACNLNSSGGQIKRVIYITFDNATLFGAGSKEDIAVRAALALPNTPENQPARQEPSTDYLGIAIHCAKGSALCKNHHARPDPLPIEPGGYGHPGFPNLFNLRATPSLDYATTMIEAGIPVTKVNTLFVIVPDGNDHFVGSKPASVGCDGITVPCTYTLAAEINAALNRLLLTEGGNSSPFAIHNDSAPTMYRRNPLRAFGSWVWMF